MPAGDIHVIDGVRYQLVDAGPGTVLGLLHSDKSVCCFCAFSGEGPQCSAVGGLEMCGDYGLFIKLEE